MGDLSRVTFFGIFIEEFEEIWAWEIWISVYVQNNQEKDEFFGVLGI